MTDEAQAIPEKPDLRDYFAGCALDAFIANQNARAACAVEAEGAGLHAREVIAHVAYRYADAMLVARGRKP